MILFKHEFFEVAGRPILWIAALGLCIFLVHAVAHLDVEDDNVIIAIYRTPSDSPSQQQWFEPARRLLLQMADVDVQSPKVINTDIASQMLSDQANIAITQINGGWRFTLKSRSTVEHRRLVRIAQLLGATLSTEKPWPVLVYEEIENSRNVDSQTPGWPKKIQISGMTADPGRQARTFVPKTIALLSYFIAFVFASRSMVRDISNNTLPTLMAVAHGSWRRIIFSKLLASMMMGLFVLWSLIFFAVLTEGFHVKDGLYLSGLVQTISITISGIVGLSLSLLARTESRIYFIGSVYLILLVLLSGLIAKIEPDERVLTLISNLFPLGYAMDTLSDWMFFGVKPDLSGTPTQTMCALLILTTAGLYASLLYYKERI